MSAEIKTERGRKEMKKYIVTAFATACLIVSQAKADTFAINFGLGFLRDHNSALVPDGSIAIVVADTSGLGLAAFNSLSPASPLTAGSFIGGDLILNSQPFSVPFSILAAYMNGTVYQNLASPLASGQQVFVLWFPTLTSAATTLGIGTQFEVIGGNGASANSIAEGGNAWTIPAGGSTVTMYADEPANFGYTPVTDLTASFPLPIPEPSTIALLCMGLVSLTTIRRRKA